ncbi:MAG: hypothetical protein ACRCYU_14900, partial [Nocardioides sp.]
MSAATGKGEAVVSARTLLVVGRRVCSVVAETGREVWWVVRCLPRLVTLILAVLVLLILVGAEVAAAGPAAALVGLVSWPRWGPDSWDQVVDRHRARHHRRQWRVIASSVGLAVHRPS